MEKVIKFKTVDEKEFTSQREAAKHLDREIGLLMDKHISHKFASMGYSEIAEHLLKNKEGHIEIFRRIVALHDDLKLVENED